MKGDDIMLLRARRASLRAVVVLGILLLGLGADGYGASPIGVEYLGDVLAEQSELRGPGRMAAGGNGTLYVTDGYLNRVSMFGLSGYQGAIVMPQPSAITVGSGGSLYIGSHRDYSVAIVRGGEISGYLGRGAGEFSSVTDIGFDSWTGNVYVADSVANLIKVYNAAGQKVNEITGLHRPMGLSTAGGEIYVLNSGVDVAGQTAAPQISVFDAAGNFVRHFGTGGFDNCQMARPTGIAAAADMVYVSDAGRDAVLLFDRTGNCLGEIIDTQGGRDIPVALAITAEGYLYVARRQEQGISSYSIITGAGTVSGIAGK
jgi:DNA-binding beta-propeller fold protein YncE